MSSNHYYFVNDNIGFVDGIISLTPKECLFHEFIKYPCIKDPEGLSFTYGSNYHKISILSSIYMKNYLKGGDGKLYLKDFIEWAQLDSECIYLVADLTLTQRKNFSLLTFYKSEGFEIVKRFDNCAIMRLIF